MTQRHALWPLKPWKANSDRMELVRFDEKLQNGKNSSANYIVILETNRETPDYFIVANTIPHCLSI